MPTGIAISFKRESILYLLNALKTMKFYCKRSIKTRPGDGQNCLLTVTPDNTSGPREDIIFFVKFVVRRAHGDLYLLETRIVFQYLIRLQLMII